MDEVGVHAGDLVLVVNVIHEAISQAVNDIEGLEVRCRMGNIRADAQHGRQVLLFGQAVGLVECHVFVADNVISDAIEGGNGVDLVHAVGGTGIVESEGYAGSHYDKHYPPLAESEA